MWREETWRRERQCISLFILFFFYSFFNHFLYLSALAPLLNDEDLVVRLTAATTLKAAIDDIDFKVEDILPVIQVRELYNAVLTKSENNENH